LRILHGELSIAFCFKMSLSMIPPMSVSLLHYLAMLVSNRLEREHHRFNRFIYFIFPASLKIVCTSAKQFYYVIFVVGDGD